LGCRGSTPSNDRPMHRPAPGSRVARHRPATSTPKSARPCGSRAVGDGASGCWGTHPRDRARPDRRAGASVVARGLLAPGRIGRRGERSGPLGHGSHAERALRVRADRRDPPLARTTTRRRALPPWSSREGRGSRGVGVHRSAHEGPDWPVLPRPSPDASCPSVVSPGGSSESYCPAGKRAHTRSPGCCSSRSASCLAAPGAELRRRSENGLTIRPHQLDRKTLCT
jgi:hypothetical protein